MNVVTFNGPAHYRITIKGSVQKKNQWLLESTAISIGYRNGEICSVIDVTVKDQAHLAGILNSIYDGHHVILKVEISDSSEKTVLPTGG